MPVPKRGYAIGISGIHIEPFVDLNESRLWSNLVFNRAERYEREYRMIEIHQPEVEQSFAGKLAWQGTTGTTAKLVDWIAIDDFKDRADWPWQHAWLTPFNVRTNETNCTQ
ncbi:DUF4268 domain-containing protein [Mariniblastus sp.]|nr:DUF4268 domain-containing protein [Mariniblastus sp.]